LRITSGFLIHTAKSAFLRFARCRQTLVELLEVWIVPDGYERALLRCLPCPGYHPDPGVGEGLFAGQVAFGRNVSKTE
jgi:hypothetical protein